jgi:hypothetical protein
VTFGWLLDEADTYVEQINARAARELGGNVVFMNGAVGGWGGAEYVAYLEDGRSSIPRPSAVLVVLSGDETRRTTESGLWSVEGGKLQRLQTTRPQQSYRLLNRLPGYTFLIEHSHLVSLARRAVIQAITASSQPPPPKVRPPQQAIDEGVALQNLLMGRLAGWCAERHIPLWVIATGYINLHGSEPDHDINRAFIAGTGPLFASLGVPYLNLVPDLDRAFDDEARYFIPVDSHPNENGARLVSELAWPWLKERLAGLEPTPALSRTPGPQ